MRPNNIIDNSIPARTVKSPQMLSERPIAKSMARPVKDNLKYYVRHACRTCGPDVEPTLVTKEVYDKAAVSLNSGCFTFMKEARIVTLYHACRCND